jgi:hypothetical protein
VTVKRYRIRLWLTALRQDDGFLVAMLAGVTTMVSALDGVLLLPPAHAGVC